MRYLMLPGVAALLMLAGCAPEAATSADNQTTSVAVPEAAAATPKLAEKTKLTMVDAPPGGPLGRWLVGTWSFEDSCGSDFQVQYGRDGSVHNAGDIGTWSLEGETLTETITERFDIGDEGETKLDPPEVRTYTVTKVDAGHGFITFENRKVPILRC